jgi:ABC-type dipeptide/oligopeptide/nickel transport system permease component
MIPADPARAYCGLKCPEETLEQIKLNLHFTDEDGEEESAWNQYKWYMGLTDEDGDGIIFFDDDTNLGSSDQGSSFFGMDFDSGGLIDGNWGYSLSYKKPVTEVLEQAVPVTLEMSFGAIMFGAPIGIFLGILSAVYQDRWLDHITRFIAIAFVSLPIFWLALMFQYLFATQFGICDSIFGTDGGCFPLSGRKPPGSEFPTEGGTFDIGHLGLSALSLTIALVAVLDMKVEGRLGNIANPETTRDKLSLGLLSAGLLSCAFFMFNPTDIGQVVISDYDATGMYTLDSLVANPVPEDKTRIDLLIQSVKFLTLPIVCLSLATAGGLLRYMRSSLLEVLNEDYIRTARAKGLRERTVIIKHGVRNALIPIVTILGFMLGGILGGAVLTETIFSLPGMGMAAVRAIILLDFAVIMGVTIITSIIFLLSNLVVDIAYAWIDPRVRLG